MCGTWRQKSFLRRYHLYGFIHRGRGGWQAVRGTPHLCVLGVVEQLQRGLQQGLDVGHVAAEVLLEAQVAGHAVQQHGHGDGEGRHAPVGVRAPAQRGQVVQLDQVEPLACGNNVMTDASAPHTH